jgi:hypothetical protein
MNTTDKTKEKHHENNHPSIDGHRPDGYSHCSFCPRRSRRRHRGPVTSGLLHTMLGLDHLLAMAAIGFWSVRQSATLKNSTPLLSYAAWSSALVLPGAV